MYLCVCNGVTEKAVRSLASDAAIEYYNVAEFLKGEGMCCKCLPRTKEIFNEEKQKQANKNW